LLRRPRLRPRPVSFETFKRGRRPLPPQTLTTGLCHLLAAAAYAASQAAASQAAASQAAASQAAAASAAAAAEASQAGASFEPLFARLHYPCQPADRHHCTTQLLPRLPNKPPLLLPVGFPLPLPFRVRFDESWFAHVKCRERRARADMEGSSSNRQPRRPRLMRPGLRRRRLLLRLPRRRRAPRPEEEVETSTREVSPAYRTGDEGRGSGNRGVLRPSRREWPQN
jgi:hypothetical protein